MKVEKEVGSHLIGTSGHGNIEGHGALASRVTSNFWMLQGKNGFESSIPKVQSPVYHLDL